MESKKKIIARTYFPKRSTFMGVELSDSKNIVVTIGSQGDELYLKTEERDGDIFLAFKLEDAAVAFQSVIADAKLIQEQKKDE